MAVIVPLVLPRDEGRLVSFLMGEEWPFHVNLVLSREKVMDMIRGGLFSGPDSESFWILESETGGGEVGLLRVYDLDDVEDGFPLFDLRIRAAFRGQGFGKAGVLWLNDYLFKKHAALDRIVGTTRVDNSAMRKIFRSCGYAKEGHSRNDWRSSNGALFDTVKYAVLRDDWETATTTPVRWDDEVM